MHISRQVYASIVSAALVLGLGTAGCSGREADQAASDAGDVDLAMLPSEAEALRAIEHPVEFELGEARLEQLLTARERLAQVEDAAASKALALDVRRMQLDGSEGPIAEIVNELQGEPATRRAIEGSGLSVRDFVSATFAMQQAVLARGVDARGALPPVLLANMQVVERNGDRVAQLVDGTPFAAVVAANDGRVPATATEFSGLTAASQPSELGPAAARTSGDAAARQATSGDASRAAQREYEARGRGKVKGRKKGRRDRDD